MLQPIQNKLLLKELNNRKSAMYSGNQFQSFECAICSFIYEHSKTQRHMATSLHYQCPMEPVHPSMTTKAANYHDWLSVMTVGKCKAVILNKLFKQNKNYTKDEFNRLLNKHLTMEKC